RSAPRPPPRPPRRGSAARSRERVLLRGEHHPASRCPIGRVPQAVVRRGVSLREAVMTRNVLVFLLDVDNTLLDNDRVKEDIRSAIARLVAADRASRFWSLYEAVRAEEGVVEFPEALRRVRRALPDEPHTEDVDREVLSVPFERYLYPR